MNFSKTMRPERIIQFGEGGFLRGFADWMVNILNEKTDFNSSVVVVQPIANGMCDLLSSQNCVYTHLVRGKEGYEKSVIDCISRCVKPYDNYDEYLALAEGKDFRFIISNTTESGIAFDDEDRLDSAPAKTFPAKLTQLLYKRFTLGLDGFIILPCELIDRNGDNLKKAVLHYADLWSLGNEFVSFIENKNHFCNTLVDRINTGYPKDESIDLGYEDKMLNTSEFFHLWVIESDTDIEKEIPFSEAGLNVIVTKDKLEMYRMRKVRILNGAHTSTVAYALLSGIATVKEATEDKTLRAHLEKCVFEEIIPTLDLPENELIDYAKSVFERFENPYIKHYWASISLNSVSKFKVRVLPSLLEYVKRFGKTPTSLVFSLAKLIELYKKDMANDDASVIEFIKNHSVREILSNKALWDADISFLTEEVENNVNT